LRNRPAGRIVRPMRSEVFVPRANKMTPTLREASEVTWSERSGNGEDTVRKLLESVAQSRSPGRRWVLSEEASEPVSLEGLSVVFDMKDAKAPLAAREEAEVTCWSKFRALPGRVACKVRRAFDPAGRAAGEEKLVPDLAEEKRVDEHSPAVERNVARQDAGGGRGEVGGESRPVGGNP